MGNTTGYNKRGKGYGGFANHAFTREEAESLSKGESLRLYGIKSNYNNGLYNVTIKENGVKINPNTGKETKVFETSDWEKETDKQKQERLAKRDSKLNAKFGELVSKEPEIDLHSLKRSYNNLSVDKAKRMSDEELSDMALAYQEDDEAIF